MVEASQDTSNVPTWDGSPATLVDFAEEVDLCMLGTMLDTRGTWPPRIARAHALGTPQRRLKLTMGLRLAVLAASDGGQKIAAKFREYLSARPEAEIWEHLMEYLFRCHRSLYESMPSCILRESLLREQAIMARKTVEPALEEILHPVIRTYLLMQNAAVPAQARISILSVCHNKLRQRSGVDGTATVDRR